MNICTRHNIIMAGSVLTCPHCVIESYKVIRVNREPEKSFLANIFNSINYLRKSKMNENEVGQDWIGHYKTFNLEHAKVGAPVIRNDGVPIRIICFDKIGNNPLVALFKRENSEEENIQYFAADGKHVNYNKYHLLMKPLAYIQHKPVFIGDRLEFTSSRGLHRERVIVTMDNLSSLKATPSQWGWPKKKVIKESWQVMIELNNGARIYTRDIFNSLQEGLDAYKGNKLLDWSTFGPTAPKLIGCYCISTCEIEES
jgi:hypothetical protein